MQPFLERLSDWTDLDLTMHELALVLGLIRETDGSFAREVKWIYWSQNPYGAALHRMLLAMVEIGALSYDDELEKVKANSGFVIAQQ